MNNYKVQAKDLDVPMTGGGARKEAEYAAERADIPLKKKYRPTRSKAAQWGTGGDHTGRKQVKVPRKAGVGTQRQMALVIGPTGKRSWVEVKP